MEALLYPSSNPGSYQLGPDEFNTPDLHTGQRCEIFLAGRWIAGHVRHGGNKYSIEVPRGVWRGYYFQSEDGSVCGLGVGMKIRIV